MAVRAGPWLASRRTCAGEYPSDWEYSGRRQIIFVSDRDIHESILAGYRVRKLPPQVRGADGGDPRMLESQVEIGQLAGAGDPSGPSRSSGR